MSHELHAWPAAHIHLARIGADIVVLDTAGDAYTCLVGGAEHLQLLTDGRIRMTQNGVLEDLTAAGWVDPSAAAATRERRRFQTPIRSLNAEPSGFALRLLPLGLQMLATTTWMHEQPLSEILDAARRLRPADRKPDGAITVDRTIGAFETVRPWLPGQGLCLQRAFSLLSCLARRGVPVDWVFGVRTWPFAAHCWLQQGDTVLADDLDRVLGFTPILIV
ncbi:lasso peptide biosynthesis B2 protein [Brevundimonas sp. NIBR10]|uniref:lasso peptide biosynthesis B2 protein n=1 Tax=Brevundimonas sp. NIBR10 TaxID=3015997 RepID=UPI0022F14815|nr:lasso peptide biosynthesis B2 protein [Brevundimonas sp. NIBR10]